MNKIRKVIMDPRVEYFITGMAISESFHRWDALSMLVIGLTGMSWMVQLIKYYAQRPGQTH